MRFSLRASLVALMCLSTVDTAFAQGSPKTEDLTPTEKNAAIRKEEVTKREHVDYTPQGVPLGGFTLLPRLEVVERYTDNLYYEQWNRKDDLVTTASPSLNLRSNWNNHEVEASVGSEVKRHRRYDREDVENYYASLGGRLDVTRDLLLRGHTSWNAGHEARSSPDDAGGTTPTKTETMEALLGGEYHGPRVRLKLEGEATDYAFKNVTQSTGAVTDNSVRDRLVSELRGRAGYEIVPEYVAFLEAVYNQRDYKSAVDRFGVNRDSHGYEFRLGTELEFSGALRGEVFGSYMWQYYDDAVFEDINAPGAGLLMTWTPTGLTTVKGGIKRTINETTSRFSAGSIATRLETSVAHELYRNVILEADGSLTRTAYENIGRHDRLWIAGSTATYKFNRNLYSALDYHVSRQENNIGTSEYIEHAAFLKLGLQY